ncbi:hypothetical protein CQW23_12848 [Capsicum baccatum]|uniref:Nucleoplasmin-like domain-containing protein n=1 Tax=Capsicum baccatum TaxID=33114 RepID=A0A2G2WTY4_CAPBA|nr:hypothetical protein CQW23_12848 [Capsicum baccatum]
MASKVERHGCILGRMLAAPWKLQTNLDTIKGIMAQLEQTMEDDYEFTLEDENNMLLPYARDQGKTKRCLLNLEFEEDHEDITFLVIGSHSVHLSGFFYGESEDCFGDEYASDPYEEGAAEIDSESSDSIKFEDVAEDGDKDGSTDDAFSMYPPSPIPNSEDEDGFSLLESKRKSATSKKSDGIEDEDTHEEALNETARGTDVGERKGLQRIVSDDTSKTYDHQSRGEQIKQKKVMDGEELAGAHPEHVEANDDPIDDDFSMYLPSPVPNPTQPNSGVQKHEKSSWVCNGNARAWRTST